MKVPYHNDSDKYVHIGATMIAPNDTRDVEETEIPGYTAPGAVAKVAAPADPLGGLLKGNVASVTAALADLPLADVEKLGELEQAGQHRKTLLAAIAEELLNRAANADMLAKVAALGDEALSAELEAVLSDVAADPDYLAALEAEAAKRNSGAAA